MELNNPMTAVSCAAPADCAAVGLYVTSRSETLHGLLLAEHQGVEGERTRAAQGRAQPRRRVPTSVSCPSRGDCVAVGYYGEHGKTHGLVVRERGGKWQRAVNAALSKSAAPATRRTQPHLRYLPVGALLPCTSYDAERTGATQGRLLSLRLR